MARERSWGRDVWWWRGNCELVVSELSVACAYLPLLDSIHNLGLVGHIEDIVVNKDQQGKKLGLRIIEALDYIAKKVGCYKVSPLLFYSASRTNVSTLQHGWATLTPIALPTPLSTIPPPHSSPPRLPLFTPRSSTHSKTLRLDKP